MKPLGEHTAFDNWAYSMENYCFRIERVLELPMPEALKAAFDAGYEAAWRKSFLRGTEGQE